MAPGVAARLLVLAALQSLGGAEPAGVAPEDARRYLLGADGSFQCFDGSGELPAGSVNDDFCDCADGSDEPGTGACAGIPSARFFCRNAGSVPKQVYASRVRDGICDCCDGSDEASGRCQDTCEAEGAVVRADRERRRTALIDGLRILKESEDKAKAAAASWQAELEALEKEGPALEAAEAEAEVSATAARKAADEAREKQVAAEVARSGVVFSEDFEGSSAEERWQRAVGGSFHIVDDPKSQRGKVLATTACTWGGDAFSLQDLSCSLKSKCKISFWARGAPWQGFSRGAKRTEEPGVDAHSWLAVPSGNPDFPDRLVSTQSSDDWVLYEYEFPQQDAFQMLGDAEVSFSSGKVHIMVQAHDSTGHCSDTMFDDFAVSKDDVVVFVDGDGDKVSFKINDAGGLDVFGNDELMVGDIADLTSSNRYLHFGGYRALAPSEDIIKRVEALWERSSHGQKRADAAAARPAAEAAESSAAGEGAKDSSDAAAPAETPKAPEISEYAKWALDQDSSDSKPSTGEGGSSGTDESRERTWNRVQNRKAPGGGSEADQALQKVEQALQEAKSKLEEHRKKREELEKKLQQVQQDPRLFALSDACVEKRIQQYSYKICFFGEAVQDSVSLGKFKEWEAGSNHSVLLYTNGQYCYGGPSRSLRVQLLCGSEGVLNEVSEPSRCTYAAEVVHPSACRQEDLQALEEQVHTRVLRPHEEL